METPAIYAFSSFQEAVQAVLQSLHERLGFQLWMFTRVEENDWIVLEAADYGYGVKSGDVFHWSDSFCSRMVQGQGPRIAPQSQNIQAYVEAPIGQQVEIAAYIGMPLCHLDGTLFGTLCAIAPTPQPEAIQQEEEFITLQTRLLTTILHYELKAQENARCYERAQVEAELDVLTGVYNRRGWERLLRKEEERCRQFGLSASVLVIDLDNLKTVNDTQGHAEGDRVIQATAQCLSENIRSQDVLARVGGDEFVILIIEATPEITTQVVRRIQQKLQENHLEASVGWAIRIHQSTLPLTIVQADKNMYQNKSERKQVSS